MNLGNSIFQANDFFLFKNLFGDQLFDICQSKDLGNRFFDSPAWESSGCGIDGDWKFCPGFGFLFVDVFEELVVRMGELELS